MKHNKIGVSKEVSEGKNMAIGAYLLIIGTLVAWSLNSEKRNRFASFHIRQAMGLNILFMGFGVLVSGFGSLEETAPFYLFFSTPFYLFFIVLWGFGIAGAIQGKLSYIPLFGNMFQKWFKKIA